jgi:hypothetical protein
VRDVCIGLTTMIQVAVLRDQRFESVNVALANTMFINCVFCNCTHEPITGTAPSFYHCAVVQPGGLYVDAKKWFEKKTGLQLRGTDRFSLPAPELIVCFKGFEIEDLNYESGDVERDCLAATVIYDLFVNGEWQLDLRTDVRQFGMSYEEDPIMLTTPSTGNYKGPFPIMEFDDTVIEFFRFNLGEEGHHWKIQPSMKIHNIAFRPTGWTWVLQVPDNGDRCGGWLLDGVRRWRKRGEKPRGLTPIGEVKNPDGPPKSSTERLDGNDEIAEV